MQENSWAAINVLKGGSLAWRDFMEIYVYTGICMRVCVRSIIAVRGFVCFCFLMKNEFYCETKFSHDAEAD